MRYHLEVIFNRVLVRMEDKLIMSNEACDARSWHVIAPDESYTAVVAVNDHQVRPKTPVNWRQRLQRMALSDRLRWEVIGLLRCCVVDRFLIWFLRRYVGYELPVSDCVFLTVGSSGAI